ATDGSSGYGFRDNSGTLQFRKNTSDSWADLTVSGGSPGGSTTQIQYNNAGAFGGITGFTYVGSGAVALTGAAATAFSSTTSSTSGKAISGVASATSGTTYGVYGDTSANSSGSGFGVYGTTTYGY